MSTVRARTPNFKFNLVNYGADGWQAPMDENFNIIDAVLRQFVNVTGVKGIWKNATKYLAGDVVVDSDNGSLWISTTEHTSPATGTFVAYRTANPFDWSPNVGIAGTNDAVATPQQFGASTDDPSFDNTAAVTAALQDALDKGIPLQLDYMFRVTSRIPANLNLYTSIEIKGNGGLYVDGDLDGGAALDIYADPDEIIEVTNIDNTATWTFPGGSEASLACAITVPGHSLSVGRICKLISNDPIEDGDGSDYKGETVYIGDVDGDVVYTTSRLADTYTSAPRLAAYRAGKRVLISGITIATNRGAMEAEGRRNEGILIRGIIGPVVNGMIAKDTSINGLRLAGCVGAIVAGFRGASGYNAVNSAQITGYGIQDDNSEFTVVVNPTGYDMRSVYTTTTNPTNTLDPWSYGPTRYCVGANGIAHDCSSSPWNWHDGSEQCSFYNMTTINLYKGEAFAYAGIQIRGKGNLVEGCRHAGPGIGVSVKARNGGDSYKHIIKGFRYDGDDYAIRCVTDSDDPQYLDISEIVAVTTYQYGAMRFSNCRVTGHDIELYQRSDVIGRPALDLRGDARVRIEDLFLDFTHVPTTGSGPKSFVAKYTEEDTAGENYLELPNVRLRTGANSWDLIKYNTGGTATDLDGIAVVEADLAPNDTDGIQSIGATSEFRRHILVDYGRTYNSARRTITQSSTPFEVDIAYCVADTVVREYTVSATKTINSISAGMFIGQKLIIINTAASSADLEIDANPSNRIQMSVDLTIAVSQAATFYWNGSVWYFTSVSVSVSGGVTITDHGSLSGLSDDDHPQYHNDSRANTWLGTKNFADLADVPALGSAYRRPRVNSGATAIEYAKPIADPAARDVAWAGPSTHESDTSAKKAATASFYPLTGDVLNVALRLFAGATKAIMLELSNDGLVAIVRFGQDSAGKPEIKIYEETGANVQHYISSDFAVFGGAAGDRSGSAKVTVVGDLAVTGQITGATQGGDYTEPYVIGNIRLWDAANGKLYAKSGSDPSSATDGTALW